MKYVRSLDGLRGMAILMVILFHYGLFEAGWIGVEIFFVLSGFLITRLLLIDRQNQSALGPFLKRFYIRRSLRIFPIYFAFLLALLLAFIVTGRPTYFAHVAPALFTYTYNLYEIISPPVESIMYSHFWSLCVEEQFYLVWPFVVFMLAPRALRRVAIGIILLAPLVRFGLAGFLLSLGRKEVYPGATGVDVYVCTFSQLDGFAFGALVALIDPERLRRRGLLFGVAASLVIAYGVLNFALFRASGIAVPLSSFGLPLGALTNMEHVFSYTLLDMTAAAGLLYLLRCGSNVLLLNSEPLVRLGRISYGLYIFHLPIQRIMMYALGAEQRGLFHILVFPLYLAVAILISQLSFSLFEQRWLRLKERLTRAPTVTIGVD